MTASPLRRASGPLAELRHKHPINPLARVAVYESLMWGCNAVTVLLYRMRAFGAHNVPRTGPVIIVANHESFLDPPVVGLGAAHRHYEFIARQGLFSRPPMDRLLLTLNSIPVHQGEPDTAAIRRAIERLERGCAVVLFPEGTRSIDGRVAHFKRGVAVLLRRTRCPVVPAALTGTHNAWPRGRPLPRLVSDPIGVIYGPPINHDSLMAHGADHALRTLRTRIIELKRELTEHLGSRAHRSRDSARTRSSVGGCDANSR